MKNFYSFILFFTALVLHSQNPPLPFETPGEGSWTAPCDVTSVTVELWGAGGAGAVVSGNGSSSSMRGGGGSGGGFVKATIAVTPGATYKYSVGGGNVDRNGESSWFGTSNTAITLLAIGGNKASVNSAAGGSAPTLGNVGGSISTFGGSGGIASSTASGGGGSSAGVKKI